MRAISTPKEAGPKNEALAVVALNIENEGVKEVWGGRIKEEEEEVGELERVGRGNINFVN